MDDKKRKIIGGIIIVVIGLIIGLGVFLLTKPDDDKPKETSNTESASKWNVHFQHWKDETTKLITVNNVQKDNTAEYPDVDKLESFIDSNKTVINEFEVTLKKPGDYFKYSFQIINEGTVDAILKNSVYGYSSAIEGVQDPSSYLYEDIGCYNKNDSPVKGGEVLSKNGGTLNCVIELRYKEDSSKLDPLSFSVSASWEFEEK